MSGFSAFVLNLSKYGNIYFRSILNGICLFSTASLSFVEDNSLVHERRVMAVIEQYVNATYYTQHPASVYYEKSQSVMGGKLFSSYDIGKSAKIETFSKFIDHLKAINERFSEWAYFLNSAKWFQRYLKFSAPR